MTPSIQELYDVIDATWPAAHYHQVGHWTIREGLGGGSRVSAATHDQTEEYEIDAAIAAMTEIGQAPIFMIRQGQEAMDKALADRGFVIKDPVNFYLAPVETIATERVAPAMSFQIFPPLSVQKEVWAAGGIGQARLAVMERAQCPKTTILGRTGDRTAGTGYVGVSNGVGMVHALETLEKYRRLGIAKTIVREMAFWARANGAEYLALVVTQANVKANALYSSLGMEIVGQYHYRVNSSL